MTNRDRRATDLPLPMLVRPQDAATMLAISKRKLWELTNGGHIPPVRMGKSVRYGVEDLRAFIEKRRVGGRSA